MQLRWAKIRRLALSFPGMLRQKTPAHDILRLNRMRADALSAAKQLGIGANGDRQAGEGDGEDEVPYEQQGNLEMYTMVRSRWCAL